MNSDVLPILAASALALAALAGCSAMPPLAPTSAHNADASYDCRLSDGNSPAWHRRVTIVVDRGGAGIVLAEAGERQLLTPVAGASGRLFASSLYAWKDEGATGVLTDVPSIKLYTCQRVQGTADITGPRRMHPGAALPVLTAR